MPNTYTQLYIQMVFAVSRRQCLIPKDHKEKLHQYMAALAKNRGCKPLSIHCMPDHAHVFVGLNPDISISDLVQQLKVESNEFINDMHWTPQRFSWQRGFGAFSYARSAISNVIDYINNQEQHHTKKTFRSEYTGMLTDAGIEYDDKYLFEFFD